MVVDVRPRSVAAATAPSICEICASRSVVRRLDLSGYLRSVAHRGHAPLSDSDMRARAKKPYDCASH